MKCHVLLPLRGYTVQEITINPSLTFCLKPVILSFQSLTVANVCQQFLLKNPRSLNPKMVPETTSINPKMVSKTTNLIPKMVLKGTNLNL